MLEVSKIKLLSVLDAFDRQLLHKILLIAVGGTAMTLLGIKASTKDIDFNIPNKTDYNEFHKLYKKISPGVEIDYYPSNMIFSEALPEDYINKALDFKSNFSNIKIKILNPIDIVCSKISRSSESDIEDIEICIKTYNIKKKDIIERAKQYTRVGNNDIFNNNLKLILETFFKI
ncbi:MAG: DUF6036 family nucleotidyltransferase [Candidatus Micrarchaeia archaeon]